MALFDFMKKTPSTISANPTISFKAPPKVILTKAKEGLDRQIVNLKKNTGANLENHKARVFVVIDRSGSMYDLYHDGSVQSVLTRLLPLGLKFDDNGEVEVYAFNSICIQLPSISMLNYETYVEKEILRKNFGPIGGTNYAPVITQTIQEYNNGSPVPAFGIFITDGDNADHDATDKVIRLSANFKIFYQFVGIGYESFNYLQKLDNLDGRKVDNTAFIKVADFAEIDDDQLFEKLLEQYSVWLRVMNLI